MDSVKDFLEMVYKEGKSISLLKRQYEDAGKELQYIKGLDYSRPHVTGGETPDISRRLIQAEKECSCTVKKQATENKR